MYVFGITGGVGAGKSEILAYLKKAYDVKILLTDELAKELMLPGHTCYDRIYKAFKNDQIFDAQGKIIKEALAALIFSDKKRRDELNHIVHPEVKKEVLRLVESEKTNHDTDAFFIEAALIIEENYGSFCDDLWYIYTSESNRRERLKASRGYTDEKIDSIIASQTSEEIFRKSCRIIIDNNGSLQDAHERIDAIMLETYQIQKKKGE